MKRFNTKLILILFCSKFLTPKHCLPHRFVEKGKEINNKQAFRRFCDSNKYNSFISVLYRMFTFGNYMGKMTFSGSCHTLNSLVQNSSKDRPPHNAFHMAETGLIFAK